MDRYERLWVLEREENSRLTKEIERLEQLLQEYQQEQTLADERITSLEGDRDRWKRIVEMNDEREAPGIDWGPDMPGGY